MSNSRVNLRFDGPSLKGHTIDVAVLAPALMAFGDLFKEANRVINTDKARVKVLVNADIKANCVTLSLDVIQETWKAVKTLLHDENVASAKDLIDWLLYGSSGVLSLIGFLKIKQDNKIQTVTQIQETENHNVVLVTITGDNNNVTVSPHVLQLAQDPKVIKAVQGIITPLLKDDGITEASFSTGKKTGVISQKEAKNIYTLPTKPPEEPEAEAQPIIAHIVVHSATFDLRSRVWEFKYNGFVEHIDISETAIAEDTLKRGKIVVGDTYKVKMEIREKRMKDGGYKNTFKVIDVLDFIPGNEQMGFQLWQATHESNEEN